jgi:hypothetical protein
MRVLLSLPSALFLVKNQRIVTELTTEWLGQLFSVKSLTSGPIGDESWRLGCREAGKWGSWEAGKWGRWEAGKMGSCEAGKL